MDETTKRRQKQKIRHLLALAEHPDTPDGERANAFARAGALMFKYEIEEADLHQGQNDQPVEDIVLYDHPVTGRGGHGRERAWALGNIAQGMGCETAYLSNDSSLRIRWVRIVGTVSTIENLEILLPTVLVQMGGAAARAARTHAAKLPSWLAPHERTAETATARRSFMRGFGRGIKEKLQQEHGDYADQLHTEAASGDSISASRELVLVTREPRVAAEFKRSFPRLKKPRKPKNSNSSAYHQGVKAGKEADLGRNHVEKPPVQRQLDQ
jgi:hypothetical protein